MPTTRPISWPMSWPLLLSVALCACGAKTGLLVPEPDDASVGGPADAPYACTPGTFALVHPQAELVVLLDRSGSMSANIDGGDSAPRKWDDLHGALAATLPDFESQIVLGAMAFPHRFDGTGARPCLIEPALDVEPRPSNARAVLQVLEGTDPWGATPTNDALEFVGSLLANRVSRTKTESIVLATDGGPNCNAKLDARTCACTSREIKLPCHEASVCLDKDRTVETIAKLARMGVSTFVIGLDSDSLPDERDALQAMAIAGGRPNTKPGAPAYYSVRDPTAVTDAFRTVQKSVVQCRLSLPSRPDDPSALVVQIDGTVVPRDPKHREGWDWASTDFGQLDFFGSACERVGNPGANPMAIVAACGDGG